MRIIIWIRNAAKVLKPKLFSALELIVGWFILGRSCKECEHSNYAKGCAMYRCMASEPTRAMCLDSFTYKHFKRRNY